MMQYLWYRLDLPYGTTRNSQELRVLMTPALDTELPDKSKHVSIFGSFWYLLLLFGSPLWLAYLDIIYG